MASEYEALIFNLMIENATLKGRLMEQEARPLPSYASVAKHEMTVDKKVAKKPAAKPVKTPKPTKTRYPKPQQVFT